MSWLALLMVARLTPNSCPMTCCGVAYRRGLVLQP